MSAPDDLTRALLEGTLGIGEHGVAEPLEGVEQERLFGEAMAFYEDLRDRGEAREVQPGVPADMIDCDFSHIIDAARYAMRYHHEPLGYVDDEGAWRPNRLRQIIRAGDRLAVDPGDRHIRPAKADEQRFIGWATSDSRPDPDGDGHIVDVRIGGLGNATARYPVR